MSFEFDIKYTTYSYEERKYVEHLDKKIVVDGETLKKINFNKQYEVRSQNELRVYRYDMNIISRFKDFANRNMYFPNKMDEYDSELKSKEYNLRKKLLILNFTRRQRERENRKNAVVQKKIDEEEKKNKTKMITEKRKKTLQERKYQEPTRTSLRIKNRN